MQNDWEQKLAKISEIIKPGVQTWISETQQHLFYT